MIIAVIAYLFQENKYLLSFLDTLIQSTKINPTDNELLELYSILIYLDYSKILKSSFEKFDHPNLICHKVEVVENHNHNRLNYLELAWKSNKYKSFKFLKDIFKNKYQDEYNKFINSLITNTNQDYNSLNANLARVSILKKWGGRKIYSAFIQKEVLSILNKPIDSNPPVNNEPPVNDPPVNNPPVDNEPPIINIDNQLIDNQFIDNAPINTLEIDILNITFIIRYAVLTYSHKIIDILLDYYLEKYLNYDNNNMNNAEAPEIIRLKDNEHAIATTVISTIVDSIITNHCPKLWVKLLIRWKIYNASQKHWSYLILRLIDIYISYYENKSNNLEKLNSKVYWGAPVDRRYSYIVYFDKLFKATKSDQINEYLLTAHYNNRDNSIIALDEFLVSFPCNVNLLKKLKIKWDTPDKPYLINAYRYSDNTTVQWLLRNIKCSRLIFLQELIVMSRGISGWNNISYSITIKFNPILAALVNPNIKVLKEFLKDYQNNKFEKYPDGSMDWFDSPEEYFSILFHSKCAVLKHSIKKLELIKDILKENFKSLKNENDIISYLDIYILLLWKDKINIKLARKGLDTIMQIFNVDSYAQCYSKYISTYCHRDYIAKGPLGEPYSIMELFMDHPSRFRLTSSEQKNILEHLIVSNLMCTKNNAHYSRILELVPYLKKDDAPINIAIIRKYLFYYLKRYNYVPDIFFANNISLFDANRIKQNALDCYQSQSQEYSICEQCKRNEYDCFLEKCQILEDVFAINWNYYKNEFGFIFNGITNRKIVHYLLLKNVTIHWNILYRYVPYHPDLIAWTSMIFTLNRYCIRRRIIDRKKHRDKMYMALEDIVFRPPIDNYHKNKYPILADGSRMYQFGLANFYLRRQGGDKLEEDQDELIYATYKRYKNIDHMKLIKDK
jgi:hypothetical protein